MGRARTDDGPQALSSGQTLARLADALARVETALSELAPTRTDPHATGLAPLRRAWTRAGGVLAGLLHDASAHSCPEALRRREDGLKRLQATRDQAERSSPLHDCLARLAAHTPAARGDLAALRLARRRAGVQAPPQTQRAITRCRTELEHLCGAFAEHHNHATEHALRELWRTTGNPSERTAAWQALHLRGREREIWVRDILMLRREWARSAGYESFAHMQCDGGALASPAAVQDWLAPPLALSRRMTPADITSPLAKRSTSAERTVARFDVAQGVQALLAPWRDPSAQLTIDLAPRPEKHAGTWATAYLGPDGTRRVALCASLPAELTRHQTRSVLHEAGHAAELLDASEVGPALYEPNRERMEVASLWFERESYEVNTLERLGFEPDAKALCRERRAAYRRPLQLQLALAATDLALHHAFDPTQDGAPLAWARRVLADAEGRERDPADSTVAMHPHLFSHPRGYAGRYVAYPLGEAAAEALVGQHGPGLPQRDSLRAALEQARTPALWSEQIRVDRWCEAIKRQQFGLD